MGRVGRGDSALLICQTPVERNIVNVSLTPELEQYVEQKLQTGAYNDSSAVMREALELLKERDEHRQAKLEELRRDIAIGLDQLARGESGPLDIEAIIADAQTRFANRTR